MIKAILFLLIAAVASSFLLQNEHCSHDQEVLCIDDINKAFPICQKAAESKGKDIPADLQCMKYFGGIQKDCWDCICLVAQTAKWHIKGC